LSYLLLLYAGNLIKTMILLASLEIIGIFLYHYNCYCFHYNYNSRKIERERLHNTITYSKISATFSFIIFHNCYHDQSSFLSLLSKLLSTLSFSHR